MIQFCTKVQKPYFGGFLGPFPIFEKMRIFPKNRALSLLSVYGPLTSCKITEKTNEPIQRKVRYGRTNRRTDGRMDRDEFIGSFRKIRGYIAALYR